MVLFSPVFTDQQVREEFGSAREDVSLEDWRAGVTLRVDWDVRYTLIADLLNNRRQWPYTTGYTGSATPRAQTCAMVPDLTTFTQTEQGIIYAEALITVSYDSSVEEDLIAESLEPTAEFITLDYRNFQWDDGTPLNEQEAPGKLLRGLNYSQQRFSLTSIHADFYNLIGGVTDADHMSSLLGFTFPAETLLYEPPKSQRTITTQGDKGWNLTTNWKYKPEGWNKFWRAKTQTFGEIKKNEVGTPTYKNYKPEDMSIILVL